MAELLTLARPYAKAAFAYASEQNATDSWSSALNLLSAAVQDEAFSAFLTRPELTPAEQVSLFAKVLGEDQTAAVSNFLTLLLKTTVWRFFLKFLLNTSSSNHRITILWM